VLVVGLMAAAPAAAATTPASVELVGKTDLGARGLNAGLALAGPCAFVGSRGQGPVAIVDVSDPAQPREVGSLPGRPSTTARELRAVPDLDLLFVLSYSIGRGGVNRLDAYHWTTGDCAHPAAAGSYDFASRPPHELFLWRQPGGSRLLLFTTMFSGAAGDLQVIDASDYAHPALIGTWTPPRGLLHSISISADGSRAFLALWTGGLLVADASTYTGGAANPQLNLLTPGSAAVPALPGGNVHSAVPAPGRNLVLVTDERGLISGAPSLGYTGACPYGPARLVDVSDPAHPRVASTLMAPENDLTTCQAAVRGNYSSHNPTLVGDLAFVTWYSSGLQVFDLSDPAQPVRLAEFRPQGAQPGAVDPQLGATATETWSYPIVRSGLIYVADVNQGLYVLRYHGPHEDQVAQTGFAEGNSNQTAAAPTPTPTQVAASSAPPPGTPPASASTAAPASRTGGSIPALPLGIAALAAVLIAAGVVVVVRRRAG
jgi:hypothetical protein